jgi:hypothetical protein
MTMSQWGERPGIDARLIHTRIERLGWSIEDAITTTPRIIKRKKPVNSDTNAGN